MNMIEIPVKLIVKAPNQQIEDQTIHCSLTWTIKRLKGYLSEVYPSKPNTEDQRLIYYGQLLNDSVTLKDIFTRYEAGEETHTVHLVCMPSKETLKMQARKMAEENNKRVKDASVSSPSTSQRQTLNEDELLIGNSRQQTSHQTAAQDYFQTANHHNWMNRVNSQNPPNNYIQQWAWMQQIYAQYYLNQYMDMIARQNGFRHGYGERRQTETPNVPEPQVARDIEDEDNRRDWLDYFYLLSRLLVLLAILYFYSSPARFLIVSFLCMALYLYQIGFFRINQIQGLENNNEAANNNNLPADNNNVPGREEMPGDGGGGGPRAEETPEQPNPVPRQNVDHPSFVALSWTFLTSFFSSIIPEAQNGL